MLDSAANEKPAATVKVAKMVVGVVFICSSSSLVRRLFVVVFAKYMQVQGQLEAPTSRGAIFAS